MDAETGSMLDSNARVQGHKLAHRLSVARPSAASSQVKVLGGVRPSHLSIAALPMPVPALLRELASACWITISWIIPAVSAGGRLTA
jgi:hypothetical protein